LDQLVAAQIAKSGSRGFRRRFRRFRRRSGGFGAEQGQVEKGSGAGATEGSGEKVPDKFLEALVQHQVRLNRRRRFRRRGFGAEPGQVQQSSGEGSGEGL